MSRETLDAPEMAARIAKAQARARLGRTASGSTPTICSSLPVSSVEWTLEPNAEHGILLPWLLGDSDAHVKELVVGYIAGLVRGPYRSHLEDEETGVFSVKAVPGTQVGLVWTLDIEGNQLVLAYVG